MKIYQCWYKIAAIQQFTTTIRSFVTTARKSRSELHEITSENLAYIQ
jgi:hypothetical protein